MKITLHFICSAALLVAASGCKKEEAKYSACATDAPVEFSLSNASGFVTYNEVNGHYAVHYIVPGSIDTDFTGIICSLPQGVQPNQQVEFSGNYRPYTGPEVPLRGGQQYYHLELTAISGQ